MASSNRSLQKAIGYGILIWVIGFAWGSIVFMTPALKRLPSIPYVSKYPAISFPLLVVFAVCAFYFAKSCLATAADKAAAALQVGAIFAAINFLLDLLVLVLLFKNGWPYFASVTVWSAYFVLFAVPPLAAR